MKLMHYSDVPLEEVTVEGARGAKIRWLVAEKDGAPNFAMRLFELDINGFTPYHAHSWEHENFIVEGEGVLQTEDGDKPFKPGDILYVPPMMKHSYRNTGGGVLKFLCMIPNDTSYTPAQEEKKEEKKEVKKTVNPFASGVANNC